VLDPFCGSGTTGEVARETGRRFVGADLSAPYLRDLALPRAENKQTAESITEMPLFAAGGS
jgi:DNA modification methylase